jgi:hypothetical protein
MSNPLLSLSDGELYKIIGVTVNIKLNNHDDTITGVIFSIIRESKLLFLLSKDSESGSLCSFMVNLLQIKEIQLSDVQLDVSREI